LASCTFNYLIHLMYCCAHWCSVLLSIVPALDGGLEHRLLYQCTISQWVALLASLTHTVWLRKFSLPWSP
jgi:hypothetical protein